MHIFSISGAAQNGKDTVADIMIQNLNGKSIKIAMADYLKFMATKYYDWDGKKDERGRSILQQLGTDKIREELGWDTFHAERVCQDIEIIKDRFDYIFIPDVRFKNEIYFTKAKFPYSVTTIHVERLGFESPLTEEQQNHRSERDLDDFIFDYYIKSENGIESVEKEVDRVLGGVIKGFNMGKFYEQYAGSYSNDIKL